MCYMSVEGENTGQTQSMLIKVSNTVKGSSYIKAPLDLSVYILRFASLNRLRDALWWLGNIARNSEQTRHNLFQIGLKTVHLDGEPRSPTRFRLFAY
jgi:hypothetical protein